MGSAVATLSAEQQSHVNAEMKELYNKLLSEGLSEEQIMEKMSQAFTKEIQEIRSMGSPRPPLAKPLDAILNENKAKTRKAPTR